jgi:putative ABC transport system permease protein
MNLFNAYKKTKFFLAVNILGLATGLAAAIMLILFVINEYSYDRHFAAAGRIVSLNTVMEDANVVEHLPINLRTAYTEVPALVPGIEAAAQIYFGGDVEAQSGSQRFQDLELLYVDPEFFDIFDMTFVEGTPQNVLGDASSLVITRPRAEAIFGTTRAAMGKTLVVRDHDYTVTAVVEPLPVNTHFSFDMLVRNTFNYTSLEFYTFYLIDTGQSIDNVRRAIEKEYTELLKPWAEGFSGKTYGETERLTDIYLKAKADWTLGKSNTMEFIWMLSALAFFILMFAITNFVNLFTAQGETRMKEIAVRKTHGAGVADLVRQLFAEVGTVVTVAFALGMVAAVQLTPAFARLIQKEIDMRQFFDPVFLGCLAGLLIVTVVLSASYTSLYLSRQNPLDIFGRRLKFLRNRGLTTAIVCFQSAVTIVLISFIMIVGRQADYLKNITIGYNPQGVMIVRSNSIIGANYDAVTQELASLPMVERVAGAIHTVGRSGSYSGQIIKLPGSTDGHKSINEYRVSAGLAELMDFKLMEGEFFTDDSPEDALIVNQATVEMLGLDYPVVGRQVDYLGDPMTITGVVGDFVYDEPENRIQPMAFTKSRRFSFIYIRLRPGTDRMEAQEAVQIALRKFDPDHVLSPIWSEDIYESKFSEIDNRGRILFVGSLLSVFLAMMGLVAIHLYSAMRRTKETGIRRILGATRGEIFMLLSRDMLCWISIAGLVAVPVAWWLAVRMFSSVEKHAQLDWTMFVIPVAIQIVVALAVTSGVSVNVSSTNPVKSLKAE